MHYVIDDVRTLWILILYVRNCVLLTNRLALIWWMLNYILITTRYCWSDDKVTDIQVWKWVQSYLKCWYPLWGCYPIKLYFKIHQIEARNASNFTMYMFVLTIIPMCVNPHETQNHSMIWRCWPRLNIFWKC